MKLLFFLGILLSISIPPYVHAQMNSGSINYSDPAFENITPSEICNCVAFRFDDVQNNWLFGVQFEMLEAFREHNVPVTIGVIGKALEGDLATYIQNDAQSQNPILEVANHGWIHEDFSQFDRDQQDQLIKKTNQQIFNVTGENPKTFLPPLGNINDSTLGVLNENKFTTFSSTLASSMPPYPLIISDIYHYPATALTANYIQETGMFQGIPHDQNLFQVNQSQEKFGFSVITLHPQEFAMVENGAYVDKVNQEQLNELVLLFGEIQRSGLKTVQISEIAENVYPHLENQKIYSPISGSESPTQIDPPTLKLEGGDVGIFTPRIPDWVRNTMQWYLDGAISEDEMIFAIQFLANEGIIKLD